MSNKISSDIHELIHAMSKTEKRYFSVFSSRHYSNGDTKYSALFNFISEQEVYDEEAIFKHFKGEAFLNQFSTTKSRLYDEILQALDLYHAQKTDEAKILRIIHSATILYKKGLYNHVEKILKTGHRIAHKIESHNLILEINELRKKILETKNYQSTKGLNVDDLNQENKSLNEFQRVHNLLWEYKSSIYGYLNKNGKPRNEKDAKHLQVNYENLKLIDISVLNYKTKHEYFQVIGAYFFSINEHEKCLDILLKHIEHLNSNVELKQKHFNLYCSVMTNLINCYQTLGWHHPVKKHTQSLIDFIKQIDFKNNKGLKLKTYINLNSLLLEQAIKQADYDKGLKTINDTTLMIEQEKDNISPTRKMYFYFQFAKIYFAKGIYKDSLNWINEILNYKQQERSDIYNYAQLLHLIIHFELNNKSYLTNALRNTQRNLRKKDALNNFENTIIKELFKILKEESSFELEIIYKNALAKLEKLSNDPFEQIAFEFFDIKNWLQSKLTKKSFEEISRRNYINSLVSESISA